MEINRYMEGLALNPIEISVGNQDMGTNQDMTINQEN